MSKYEKYGILLKNLMDTLGDQANSLRYGDVTTARALNQQARDYLTKADQRRKEIIYELDTGETRTHAN